VSLLNACLTLLKDGYTQEVYILCRSIEEATEDIYFFAAHDGESGTSENQKKALQTFYQEQFEDPYDPYSSIPRSYVRREDIRKTASKLHPSPTTRAELKKTASAIYSTFSGFVHGSYVFIMELYGGEKPHYHMLGMPNTPRISECEGQMVYSIYRAFMAAEAVALRTKNVGLAKKLNVSSKEFANRTGCLSRQHL
jgi:hypothetical protein